MPGKVSNPRDLFVLLLGELLYVERRLAGAVLRDLASAVESDELSQALEEHLVQTKRHVERVETVFRRIEVSATANRSDSFESAVSQHDKLAGSIVTPGLGDVFHAVTALRTEHWEIATYRSLLQFGAEVGYRKELTELGASLDEEERARDTLVRSIASLAARFR